MMTPADTDPRPAKTPPFRTRGARLLATLLGAASLAACSALQPSKMEEPAFYALEAVAAPLAPPRTPPANAPTLVVRAPKAAAGYDSQRIIYLREPHRLEYFAHSEWVDPPARMIGPLLVAAAQGSGGFRAVVLAPAAATGDLQLDTEVLRLQHEFQTTPSQVRFTLRATLVDERTRRVLASRDFDARVPAATADPYGGVLAANQAVQAVVAQVAAFSAEAAALRPAATGPEPRRP